MAHDDCYMDIAGLLDDDFLDDGVDAFIRELEGSGATLDDDTAGRTASALPPRPAVTAAALAPLLAPLRETVRAPLLSPLLAPLLEQLDKALRPHALAHNALACARARAARADSARAARAYRKARLVEKRSRARMGRHTHYAGRRAAAAQRVRAGGRFQKQHVGEWLTADERRVAPPRPAHAAAEARAIAPPATTAPPPRASPPPQPSAAPLAVPLVPPLAVPPAVPLAPASVAVPLVPMCPAGVPFIPTRALGGACGAVPGTA